ncbi:MAG: flavodoxin-dependent (E)-4-hydroxy-3-methylbut-2-enyl-diphosphate synthase [Defluviitaleaceae bacterium]|nr:flavodoxin-dependent (E)-4-hydroxy-3-methylbut-2-enyl-diphosphate synthase [Defluviitaleaceae bacterium]MCL2263864.1 flavodoxin-dependent (E)-4-hydroxy-3-methylbut-2-enyl-diphosphate synthase [Defluviitaleaceae bacterium]
MITRANTKIVNIGGVRVGGGHPVVVQSMTNTDTRDVAATVAQINALAAAGCEIVRVAVPDTEAAEAIAKIKKQISLPLVADIHFDHRLALAAIKNGADKLRINPGNIGSESRVREVAEAAKANGLPIRVGVNGGSLEKSILEKHGGVTAQGLAESALCNIALLEKFGFGEIVVSVKASNVPLMLDAHKILAQELPYPIHIGLTEAGTPLTGAIRSAAGLGALLSLGLGDTLRVSLSGDPVAEIHAAREILSAMGLRRFGVTVIACPTCGRTDIDVAGIATRLEQKLSHITTPITVAVMGCAVNGPGEAREADIGIAGARGGAVLFRKGEILRKVPADELEETVLQEIAAM